MMYLANEISGHKASRGIDMFCGVALRLLLTCELARPREMLPL